MSSDAHDARHTHVTTLLRDGIPVTVVAARVGHSDPSLTLKTYSHLLPGDDERASEAVERLMFG